MVEGARVLTRIELAQPKQCPSRRRVAAKRHENAQYVARFRVVFPFVKYRAKYHNASSDSGCAISKRRNRRIDSSSRFSSRAFSAAWSN